MIEILQEITDWSKSGINVQNGIYHVNSFGYLVQYNDTVFKTPLKRFSKARRKFVKIGERPEEHKANVVKVEGSNGKVYTVIDGKCSCPGFKFRGKCKHIENI